MTAPEQVASSAQDEATKVFGSATEQAGNVKDEATSAASQVAGTTKEQIGDVVDETVTQAKDLAAQVKEQATHQLDSQSSKAIEQVRGVSTQLTSGDTSGVVGQLMTEAGQRLQSFSDYVERVGPQGLVEDVRRYARRNPGTFVLGAALAGLVSGRVARGVKAGHDSAAERTSPQPTSAPAPAPVSTAVTEVDLRTADELATPYPEGTYAAPTTPQSAPTLLQDTGRGGLR